MYFHDQVKFMGFINNAQIKAAQRLHAASQSASQSEGEGCNDSTASSAASGGEIFEDFFSAIKRGREEGITAEDIELIWGRSG